MGGPDSDVTVAQPKPPAAGGGGSGHDRLLSPRQYAAATAALYLSSLTSGATSMVLLLSSLRAGHSVWQTSIIFASYQAASAVAALGAGAALGGAGLRPVLAAAFVLQAGATAALIPLRARERTGPGNGVAWPLATATAYASAINAVIGVSRVLARTASKALPKLAEGGGGGKRDSTRAAGARDGRSARLLMLRTALVTGGRTALKGAGSLLGGGLEQGLGYSAAIGLLAALTLPAALVALAAVPGGAGKGAGGTGAAWPSRLAAPVAVVTASQALQNAAQFAWLQVPLAHLLTSRGGAFKFSRTATGGAMAGVLIYEGAQQLVAPRLLRWLGQAPPGTTPAVLGLWGGLAAAGAVPLTALCAASAAAGPSGILGAASPRGPAAAAFFPALWANVAPTQLFSVLLAFTLQAVMDRTAVAATAGANTAGQALGRAAGVLAAGAMYGGMTGDWGGHRHHLLKREEEAAAAGRPDDSDGPVGPFAATMALTAGLAALSALVAWVGLPPPPPGAPRGVACGPAIGCCGAGDRAGDVEEEGGGAVQT